MDLLTDVLVPLVTILLMVVVGLGLAFDDFVRVGRYPLRVATACAGQLVLLPLLSFALVAVLEPPAHRVLALIVIAACPGGAMSNLFTALARADTALSVSITGVSTLASTLTLPIAITVGLRLFTGRGESIPPPVAEILLQLVLFLLLPILFGMWLRRRRRELALRTRPLLLALGLVGYLLCVIVALGKPEVGFAAEGLPGTALACFFLLPAMAIGYLLGRLTGAEPEGRMAFVAEFGFSNLGIATLVAVRLLGSVEFLAFAVFFLAAQVVISTAAVFAFRAGLLGR
jgi:BASS family bile acid:Na+ symporter